MSTKDRRCQKKLWASPAKPAQARASCTDLTNIIENKSACIVTCHRNNERTPLRLWPTVKIEGSPIRWAFRTEGTETSPSSSWRRQLIGSLLVRRSARVVMRKRRPWVCWRACSARDDRRRFGSPASAAFSPTDSANELTPAERPSSW